jgi:tRNA-dependent cyclodipeptide synthase
MLEVCKRKVIAGSGPTVSRVIPCLYGVSVSSWIVDLSELRAVWDWTRTQFDRCAVLLGDSLHRLTVQAQMGLDTDASRAEASRRADRMEAQLRAAIGHEAVLIRTSAVAARQEFSRSFSELQEAFGRCADFRNAIRTDALRYCERQVAAGRLNAPFESAIQLSVRYLLEEVATYNLLAQEGWLAETYQGGELYALAKFMRGDFPGLAPALEKRVHISLRVSKRR